MKNMLSILVCTATAALVNGQARPVQVEPVLFQIINGTTNDLIDALYHADGRRMTIKSWDSGADQSQVGLYLATPYGGGTTITFHLDAMPLPKGAAMAVEMYSFLENDWLALSMADGNAASSITLRVPAEQFVDPAMGLVYTRVTWYSAKPLPAIWVDATQWGFGY